ncbi:MAG: ATP-grasp domain-containing protein [Candidatus Helarchaeota archaeon]
MNKLINVLIPGAGGAAAICTIQSLKLVNYKGALITTDSNKLSAGFYLADRKYIIPRATDKNFIDKAKDIIIKNQIKVILPTSGYDIIPYSRNKEEIEELDVFVAMSDYEVINNCINKLKTYKKLGKSLMVKTSKNVEEIGFPCILKPIKGKGSRNIYLCNNKSEFEIICKHINKNNFIIQEYLPGKEFTVDVLSDFKAKPIFCLSRERIEIKAGITFKGRVFRHKEIESLCMRAAQKIGLKGPSCIQIKLDKNNNPKIIEINPRIGGASIFSTYANFNIPLLTIKLTQNIKISIPKIHECTILRYYENLIID